jgi:aspartate racemase
MHKRIGILGGMSPESTVEYYQYITRTYTERYGDYGYPEVLIYSVSFQPYVDWPSEGRWDQVADGLSAAARQLEAAGADFIVIATNTMHLVVDEVQAALSVPVLSLLDAVGVAIRARGLRVAGLLGTRFTMEKGFYADALAEKGIRVLVPEADEQRLVDDVIYHELVCGEIREASRRRFVEIIEGLAARGAQGVILGCTEIPLLVRAEDVEVPLFDTTLIHAEAALNYALA